MLYFVLDILLEVFFEVKKSKFFVFVVCILDCEMVMQYLVVKCVEYFDVCYYCWVYLLGNLYFFISVVMFDDGEFSGIVGKLILNVL